MNRRELLFGFFKKLPLEVNQTKEIILGTLSDFPPESEYDLNNEFKLVSSYEGIYVLKKENNKRFALSLDRTGKIILNPKVEWENNTVLSIMSGEKKYL